MTLREFALDYLTGNGLWPAEAEAVVAAVMAAPENAPMKQRWGDGVGDYHPSMRAALVLSLNHRAVKWIDENAPMHFARTFFDEATP